MVEPFGAGGGPDVLARALGPKLAELWGQPVTAENHPGATAERGVIDCLMTIGGEVANVDCLQ